MSQMRWVMKTHSRKEGLGFEQLGRTGKCKLTGFARAGVSDNCTVFRDGALGV